MGSTVDGANWTMKALHPASDILSTRGIPDEQGYPSVTMDYEIVQTILPPLGIAVGDTWNAAIYTMAHPVQPVSVVVTSVGGITNYGGMFNPNLVGNSAATLSNSWIALCNSWRMLYASTTVDLDASALNNQGSVVAAQIPLAYTIVNAATSNTVNPFATVFSHVLAADYAQNKPGILIGQLPGAYAGLAQDGIYLPVKINPKAPWASSESPWFVVPAGNQLPAGYNLPNVVQAGGTCFPYYGEVPYQTACGSSIAVGAVPAYCAAINAITGSLIQPVQQENIGVTYFYNMAYNSRLTCKVRWGVEMRVPCGSVLAPAMKPSAHYDTLALAAFSELAATLPWAYPSSYNADGKIIGMIKSAWNALKPAISGGLSLMPHPLAQGVSFALNALPSFERPAGNSQMQAKKPPRQPTSNMSARINFARSTTPQRGNTNPIKRGNTATKAQRKQFMQAFD